MEKRPVIVDDSYKKHGDFPKRGEIIGGYV
jgi:hypothetical protein